MRTIVFFNNKGGVGKTTLLYHCAYALADLGKRVTVVDLDPQANLTSFFFDEDEIEDLWRDGAHEPTVYTAILDLLQKGSMNDVSAPKVRGETNLRFLPGDMRLSDVEDALSNSWSQTMNEGVSQGRALNETAAFHHLLTGLSRRNATDFALLDVGPNFGAINRSALIAADYVVVPLGADLFSIRGLRNLGPRLSNWRSQWQQRLSAAPESIRPTLPNGAMLPLGFTVNMFNVSRGAPATAFQRWIDRAPSAFADTFSRNSADDLLGKIQNFHSQMPVAQEARLPIFRVNNQAAFLAVGDHFRELGLKIIARIEALSGSAS